MHIDLFDYELPNECIAQHPAGERDGSRLLVLDRKDGTYQDKYFRDIVEYLREGDLLVFNNSKVIKARLIGIKQETGARIEIFLLKRILKQIADGDMREIWECIARPAKRLRIGDNVMFGDPDGIHLVAVVKEKLEDGGMIVAFNFEKDFAEILDCLGRVPLPPYIHRDADNDSFAEEDARRYQTVYASEPGSAAAPTAGLHFTDSLLNKIRDIGVDTAFVTLHVGLGTFRPVKTEHIEDHVMHLETYHISEGVASKIKNAKEENRRVICVGTTSVRAIEAAACGGGLVPPGSGDAGIFIYPGGRGFSVTDALITNFHLPKSTLLMLVSAFAGRENILEAYVHAIVSGYRFFSYGDAMFIQ